MIARCRAKLTRRAQLDMVYDVDIRQPSIHRQDFTWVTDYLIGCHNNSVIPASRDNDLCVFAGSNEYVLRVYVLCAATGLTVIGPPLGATSR